MSKNDGKRFVAKNIIITGGSSGIGFATAMEFAKLGAKLYLIARDPGRLQQARLRIAAAYGNEVQVRIYSADVADRDNIQQVI